MDGTPSADAGDVVALLPEHVIDRIAAGEVVERPASVVKELAENALDAGARAISVDVEGAGRRLIRVVDDGGGMSPRDARLALARHATSKLRDVDDLWTLGTMGFRGEALPSIASVSRLVLTTRRQADEVATRIVVDGGRVVDEATVGAPVGTCVEVHDLLGNVPARLKFLKGDATETAHVTEAVQRLAMTHPRVHLRLRVAGRAVVDAPPCRADDELAAARDRARMLLGARLGDRLHPVRFEEAGVRVLALVGDPELAQATSRGVQLYVGRRFVRDRALLHAVTMGYGELVPRGRYPVAVVMIDVPGAEVDVNVHPQKLEVRFSDAAAVAATVRHAVRRAVGAAPWLAGGGAAPVRMVASSAVPPPSRAADLAGRYAEATTRALFPLGGVGRTPAQSPLPGPVEPVARGAAVEPVARGAADEPVARGAADEPAARGGGDDGEAGGSRWAAEVRARLAERAHARDPGGGRADLGGAAPRDPGASPLPGPGATPPRLEPASTREPAERPAPERSPATPAAAAAADPAAGGAFFGRLRYLGQLDRTYLVCEGDGELVLIDQHAAHERVEYQRLRERSFRREVPVQRLLFPHTIEVSTDQAAVAADAADVLARAGFEVEPFGGGTVAIKAVPAGLRDAGGAHGVLRQLLGDLSERGGSRAVEERLDHALATIACHSVVRAGDVLGPREAESLLAAMDGVDFRAHCPHGRPVLLRVAVDELARRFGR